MLPRMAWRAESGRKAGGRKAEGGKRNRYDIDKMGSFGLWFADATNSAGGSWWNGFSRLESRRGANAVVRESGRLPSIRAGFGAESGTGTILTRWGVLDYGSPMPRTARVAPGGMVFHVLNRGVARMQLFEKAADYQAFEQVLRDTLDQSPMRICAYAVMPNHWHLLLWPECDGELAAFMQRLTITHVRRWQEHRGYAGLGHVYQGRYKSFPVESDEHFWVVARYVERNALRANLVLRAEEWRWSSLWQRCHPTGEERSLLAAWPIDMPANWLERVNQTDNAQELEALRRSVQRGRPFGQPEWQKEIAKRLGLESAYRPTGRPRKVGRNQNASPGCSISDLSRFPCSGGHREFACSTTEHLRFSGRSRRWRTQGFRRTLQLTPRNEAERSQDPCNCSPLAARAAS